MIGSDVLAPLVVDLDIGAGGCASEGFRRGDEPPRLQCLSKCREGFLSMTEENHRYPSYPVSSTRMGAGESGDAHSFGCGLGIPDA